ncbi:MAG: hypothetical protein M3135_01390 [Actinomycetota bacterium]|nr:hypothetical protein [Actinomycetota bacterium]
MTVLVAGTAVWFLLFREGGLIPDGEHPVADFQFQFGKVGGSSVGEPAPEDEIRRTAAGIRRTLDAMYLAGFLDPDKWEGGEFPEVLDAFAEGTRQQASRDIGNLSLGGDAPQIEFMDPARSRLNVRILIDAEGTPTGAVADSHFSAKGQLKRGGPVFAIHDATYFLRPDGRRWLIVGYDVSGVVQPGSLPVSETGPTVGPTGEAT